MTVPTEYADNEDLDVGSEISEVSSFTEDDPTSLTSWFRKLKNKAVAFYNRQSPVVRCLIVLGIIAVFIFDVYVAINYKRYIKWLAALSDRWAASGAKGWWGLFMMIVLVSFPPLIGFGFSSTLAGMAYGIEQGWVLVALASIFGSTCSFTLFKYLLKDKAAQLMEQGGENLRLVMLALNDPDVPYWENVIVLLLLKLSPLPYSFCNGAVAAIPNVSVGSFALAATIASPKWVLVIFVAVQVKNMGEAEHGNLVRLISILVTTGSVAASSYVIWSRVKRRLAERENVGEAIAV